MTIQITFTDAAISTACILAGIIYIAWLLYEVNQPRGARRSPPRLGLRRASDAHHQRHAQRETFSEKVDFCKEIG